MAAPPKSKFQQIIQMVEDNMKAQYILGEMSPITRAWYEVKLAKQQLEECQEKLKKLQLAEKSLQDESPSPDQSASGNCKSSAGATETPETSSSETETGGCVDYRPDNEGILLSGDGS